MIGIIDYGLGNLGSVLNMLNRIGIPAKISSSPSELQDTTALILPGVGAFDYGVKNLHSSGLWQFLEDEVLLRQKPILGICLGAQLLLNSSEEGCESGLGWITGHNIAFDKKKLQQTQKIPNMGWRNVKVSQPDSLTTGFTEETRFYFVHSYHFASIKQENVIITGIHGYEFPAGIRHNHIAGVQFHPEKSHRFGMSLLQNYFKQTQNKTI